MVQNLRLVDDSMNVTAGKSDRATRDQIRGNRGHDDCGPGPPPPPGAAPPPPHHRGGLLLLPNPRVMIITIVIATLMSTLPPLYAVACFIKMQELVQLVVLAGVICRKSGWEYKSYDRRR